MFPATAQARGRGAAREYVVSVGRLQVKTADGAETALSRVGQKRQNAIDIEFKEWCSSIGRFKCCDVQFPPLSVVGYTYIAPSAVSRQMAYRYSKE